MKKTGQEIEDDVYNLVKNSELATFVNGDVEKFGLRERNSKKEDITVQYILGTGEEIQRGIVHVAVYVPDIKIKGGLMTRNITRLIEVERQAQVWADSLDTAETPYVFSLDQTIKTMQDAEINQHFVSIRLKYELINN